MEIYKAINSIMNDMDAITKSKRNTQQGFMYRGVDDVMNALQPLLVKYGVFAVPEVLTIQREERTSKQGNALIYTIMTVKYTFYAIDGSSVNAIVSGEGMDSADKSANKALSVAFKYACFQVFCIPTEDMDDPDKDTPIEMPYNGKTQAAKAPIKPKAKAEKVDFEKLICECCGKPIEEVVIKGKHYAPKDIVKSSKDNFDGKQLCWVCGNKERVQREIAKKKAETDAQKTEQA